MLRSMPSVLACFTLVGCGLLLDTTGSDAGTAEDAAAPPDAGTDAAIDAGPPPECTAEDSRPCGIDTGECARGTQACAGGTWGPCEGDVGPSPEVCDGLDNDCDGAADEDDPDVCSGSGGVARCLLFDPEGYRCIYMACPGDPCCDLPMPCAAGWTCEHLAFVVSDCPRECAGQCGNCHMCVR